MKISIVIPVYNEEENLPILHREITQVMKRVDGGYEVIFVNDGSRDTSGKVLADIANRDPHVVVIEFARNFGQTAAMSAGIRHAHGDIVIPMDADLQNDPTDIPRFLEEIDKGHDVVSGWRKDRKDALVMRKIPSQIANRIIGLVTGVRIHDYGCSMKAYRRDVIQGVALYGEMHRFIPAYASWHGGTVSEIVVNHRARVHGTTKYGISRTFRVILDLIVVKFLSTYMNRPMHFFGGAGIILGFLGGLALVWALVLKFFFATSMIQTPLPIFSALLIIVGVQCLLIGILGEMMMRTYYEARDRTPYSIKKVTGGKSE